MRNIDGKFSMDGQRIFNTVSGEDIPLEEPLFVLRARDINAISTLIEYKRLCQTTGCNELQMAGIDQVLSKFVDFRQVYPDRMKEPGVTRALKLEDQTQGD